VTFALNFHNNVVLSRTRNSKQKVKKDGVISGWIGNIFFVMNIVSLMKIFVEKWINFLFFIFSIIFG